MLKDAKIHFFAILWFLFWRKKVAIAGLNSLFKPCHVGLLQVSENMSFLHWVVWWHGIYAF
jgi:hypothetical protein